MRLLSRATYYYVQANCVSSLRFIDKSPSPFYQHRPLSTSTSTRLLELHPANHETDILSFTLFEVDLEKAPYYEALSYERGEPTGTIPTLYNGKHLLITPNLKQAMTHIRSSMPPDPQGGRVLWIDAVCIDQPSLQERSHQASPMNRIYYEAVSIIFYLGSSTNLIASALRNITLLAEQYNILSQEVPGWSSVFMATLQVSDNTYLNKILPLWKTILSDPDCVAGLYDLCGRSYFTRAWIVQEILLSQHGTLLLSSPPNTAPSADNVGVENQKFEPPWKALLSALGVLQFGARYRLIEQFPVEDPRFSDIIMIPRRFRWLKNLTAALAVFMGGRHPRWPVLLCPEILGPFMATDPRDKVYASTGFIDRFPEHGAIINHRLTRQHGGWTTSYFS